MDYRIYALIALLLWGLWAFFPKILIYNMKTELLALYTTLGSFIAIIIYTLVRTKVTIDLNSFWAILIGVIGMIGTFSFYVALFKGPVSIVVPWTGLYIIIPVILGFIFLKEPLTINHIIGIILALLAIFFLSR